MGSRNAPTTPTPTSDPPRNKDKGKERVAPSAAIPPRVAPLNPPQSQTDKKQQLRPKTQARAVVLHAAPTKYNPGQIRCWIKGDNQGKVRGYTMAAARANADWRTSIPAGYIPGGKSQHQPGHPHREEDFLHHRV